MEHRLPAGEDRKYKQEYMQITKAKRITINARNKIKTVS